MSKNRNCDSCKVIMDTVWFTDSVFWNAVTGIGITKTLCPNCFIIMAEQKYKPIGWRLIPEFPWLQGDEDAQE